MTKDDIIRMAKKSGIVTERNTEHLTVDGLERFAALVAAAEREECARVCEERAGTVSMFANSTEVRLNNSAVKGCAVDIRARNNQT